jgi:type I site-specific restriction-modification system R (restriction) subunit
MMKQSREDGNTVPIYYEGRLAEVRLTNECIDEEFEEITEREEEVVKEKLKTKWARLEALAGTESRLKRIAQDIVHHFNNREVEGKAMVVCMSRRIAVKMYELLKQIPNAPETAVVITRPEDFGLPGTTKQYREDLKARFKDPDDYSKCWKLPEVEQTRLFQRAHNAVTIDTDTKEGFLRHGAALSKAFALVSPHKEANDIRNDILFFQSVRRSIRKYTPSARDVSEDVETAIKQLISGGISSDEVVDIFGFTEKERPDISILSDEFLNDIQKIEYKNLQVELLKKLINDEITGKMKRNVVTYRSFKEMLEKTIAQYKNRSIESAEVIERLIEMARELRNVEHRAEKIGLSDEEIAFYDAVSQGRAELEADEQLLEIAKELVATIKCNLSIDWTDHENAKSKIRASVKRLLRKRGFKSEDYKPIVSTIMEQAISLYHDYTPVAAESSFS